MHSPASSRIGGKTNGFSFISSFATGSQYLVQHLHIHIFGTDLQFKFPMIILFGQSILWFVLLLTVYVVTDSLLSDFCDRICVLILSFLVTVECWYAVSFQFRLMCWICNSCGNWYIFITKKNQLIYSKFHVTALLFHRILKINC